jgi:hypothetical protein
MSWRAHHLKPPGRAHPHRPLLRDLRERIVEEPAPAPLWCQLAGVGAHEDLLPRCAERPDITLVDIRDELRQSAVYRYARPAV